MRARENEILVPQDPSKVLDGSDQQVLLTVHDGGDGDFPEPDDAHWGFFAHDACWCLFSGSFQVDLNHLFLFYCSSYLGNCDLVNWGGDYGGAAEDDGGETHVVWSPKWNGSNEEHRGGMPDLYKANPLQIPTLRKAIAFSARLQQDDFHSKLDPQKLSLDKDIFSHLPTEIAETILTHLPSPDVHSLRLASPVFATLTLLERFWASRFCKGKEFDFVIPDVLNSPPTSWRALYLSLRIWAEENLAMKNRRRIWKIIDGIHDVLLQIRDKTCFGMASPSILEPEPTYDFDQAAEGYSWLEADRTTTHASDSDLRKMRYRSLSFPGPIQVIQVSVSLFNTPDGPFVSGLSFVDLNGQVAHLGYCHPGNIVHIELPGAQRIQGFEVVHDCLGVRAIAVVAQDGTVSSFAGTHTDHPWKRIVSSEGISSVRGAFDVSISLFNMLPRMRRPNSEQAVKLLSLGQTTRDAITYRTGYFWYKEIPGEEFLFNGALGDLVPRESYDIVRTAFFKPQGVNRNMIMMMCENTDICHVADILFHFQGAEDSWEHLNDIGPLATGSPPVKFERTGFASLHIDIDGWHEEEITTLDVQLYEGLVCGLKVGKPRLGRKYLSKSADTIQVHTNHGRSQNLTSQESPILNDPRYPWVRVSPKGSKIVGMYVIGAAYAVSCHLFCDWAFGDANSI